MALPDNDSSVGWSFGLEIDGVQIKQITKVSGISMEQDVIELKENTADGKYLVKKLPGRTKPGQLTVTRGLTGDQSIEKWAAAAQGGKMGEARKSGALIIYDFEGTAVKRYTMKGAWCSKIDISEAEAGATTLFTETATVTYEEMAIEQGGG